MYPLFFELDGGILTGLSACAEYGLCASTDFYLEYHVQNSPMPYLIDGTYISLISTNTPTETVEMGGKRYVCKNQAIVDACYFYHDDSALAEIFETLEYDDELESWVSYAKSVSMDSALLSYVLSMFTEQYRDSFEGPVPLILSNRSLYKLQS